MAPRLKPLVDIDNTLHDSEKFATMARQNAISAMQSAGLKGDFASLEGVLEGIIEQNTSNNPRHFDDMLIAVGVKDRSERSRLVQKARRAYHDTKIGILRPYPDVPLALYRLKVEKGYDMYIASDGYGVQQWEKVDRMGLEPFFNRLAFITKDYMYEIQDCQKNEAFFKLIINRLGILGSDAVMIDDNPAVLDSAKKVGLYTIRILRGKFSQINFKADYAIQNFEPLPDILDELNAKVEEANLQRRNPD